MKKIYILTMLLLMSVATFAQSQDYMSYQAVIRNASNNLITNQPVGMKISILQGSAIGTAVYEETQTPTSNINGLVTLAIGGGSTISGSYGTINWANGPYFIKTETDPTGGTNYTIVGVTQFLSVPYALYAANSGSSIPGPQGPAGLNGTDGINGLDGATGPMGPQGPAGLNGAEGANGLDGATGPMGPQGPAGLNGADGANGLDGAIGPMGPQGPAGINGIDGATGPMGPQGPMGPSGVPTAFTFLSKTTDYTITSSDILNNVYLKNTSNSLITITLPSASIAGSGKMIYITSTSTSLYQSINVLSNGIDSIYGFYSNPTGTMNISTMTSSNIGWIQLISDGTSWNILGMYW